MSEANGRGRGRPERPPCHIPYTSLPQPCPVVQCGDLWLGRASRPHIHVHVHIWMERASRPRCARPALCSTDRVHLHVAAVFPKQVRSRGRGRLCLGRHPGTGVAGPAPRWVRGDGAGERHATLRDLPCWPEAGSPAAQSAAEDQLQRKASAVAGLPVLHLGVLSLSISQTVLFILFFCWRWSVCGAHADVGHSLTFHSLT